MIFVNKLSDFVINNNNYVVGFEKLLLTMANSDNASELQKMLDDYITTLKATITANKVASEKEE